MSTLLFLLAMLFSPGLDKLAWGHHFKAIEFQFCFPREVSYIARHKEEAITGERQLHEFVIAFIAQVWSHQEMDRDRLGDVGNKS